MYQIQSTPKSFAVRAFAALLAASVLLTPLAMAAEQNLTASVAAINTLSITGGAPLALSPTVAAPATDSTTELAFNTNDGSTYKITVTAGIWEFSPFVGTVATNPTTKFPVLSFVSASGAGTTGATAVLINDANTALTDVPVVIGLISASGTVTVTLDATISQLVVAGDYSTTLTYALVTP